MRFQIARARAYYARGLAGVWLLPPEVRLAILIAGRLYRVILSVIEANEYEVLYRRAATSRLRKVSEGLAAILLLRFSDSRLVYQDPTPRAARLAEMTAWLR
jgi:phytoene synthase